MPNNLYSELCAPKTLYNGWHLTRNDINRDFYLDDLRVEAFAANLRQHILDISSRLSDHTYRFGAAAEIAIPKGVYGTRPGSILGISDRIVLWSLIKLISLKIDRRMPAGVSSYRLKKTIRSGDTNLFSEKEEVSIPFLKGSTINTDINPFSSWVYNWREFDKASKDAYGLGYEYLAVTDISAYFENINLEILKGLLLEIHPSEQGVVNLILDAFQNWTVRTLNGYRPLRGIPQGSGICSFFGNMYLIHVDEFFTSGDWLSNVIYLRYMDDIRIFCKSKIVAAKSILAIEEQLRRLHLSVQSAKTKLYLPSEVIGLYSDPRIDDILKVRERYPSPIYAKQAVPQLLKIGGNKYDSNPPIDRRFAVRESLFERSTRLWMNSLMYYGNASYIPSVEHLATKNADPRYSEILIRSAKRFGRYSFRKGFILNYLKNGDNLYDYHESSLIESFRYMKGHSSQISDHCFKILSETTSYSKKIAAIRYLSKGLLSPMDTRKSEKLFRSENNSFVRCNLFLLLVQQTPNRFEVNFNILKRSVGPHEKDLCNFLTTIGKNSAFTRGFLKYIFDDKARFRLHDWAAVVAVIAKTTDPKLRNNVEMQLTRRIPKEGDIRLRNFLSHIKRLM